VLIGQISLVLSAGYGYRFILKFHWYESAGYEASGSSTSNFIGLQAGYPKHLTQISWVCMLGRSNKC
jgi:hypothetical protein